MNRVPINSLKADSYINKMIYLDDNYILLSSDIAISNELINRLQKWHYTEVQIDETSSIEVSIDGVSNSTATAILDISKDEVNKKFFDECVQFLIKYYTNFQELGILPILPITSMIKKIIEEQKHQKNLFLDIDIELKERDSYLIIHSIKTTFLVLLIADFLKFPVYRQIEIGIAAMLHKLGILRLPAHLYQKKGFLTPKELQIIRTHPIISFKTLKNADFHPPIYFAILEHREHIDGTGYPRKLKGDKISLYGKILAVASAYVAATTKKPFREKFDGSSGIMNLMKGKGSKYDDEILRSLIFIMTDHF